MWNLFLSGLLLLWPLFELSQVERDGPFGIYMGMTADELATITGRLISEPDSLYVSNQVQNPHRSFSSCEGVLSEIHGVCAVRGTAAFMAPIDISENIFRQLKQRYGQPTTEDIICSSHLLEWQLENNSYSVAYIRFRAEYIKSIAEYTMVVGFDFGNYTACEKEQVDARIDPPNPF